MRVSLALWLFVAVALVSDDVAAQSWPNQGTTRIPTPNEYLYGGTVPSPQGYLYGQGQMYQPPSPPPVYVPVPQPQYERPRSEFLNPGNSNWDRPIGR